MLSPFYAIFTASVKLLLRRKAPAALIVLIALAGPVSSYFLFTGDGTLGGALRMVMTYNYYITSTALMLLVLYLSTTVLDCELTEDQMSLTASKPVPRWQILLGKWLAVGAITGAALLLAGTAGYVVLQQRVKLPQVMKLRTSSPQTQSMSLQQREQDARAQIAQVEQELLVSRVPFQAQVPTVDEELRVVMSNLRAANLPAGQMPPESEVRRAILLARKKQAYPIPFNSAREYLFQNLPQTKDPITVRYTLNGTTDPGELGWLRARWAFAGAADKAPYVTESLSRSGTTREFRIPGEVVPPDGQLRAAIINDIQTSERKEPQGIEVPIQKGFSLMIPQGGFGANYARGMFLLWIRILMLAAIGVGATAFMSGSVSAFVLCALIAMGSLSSFVATSVLPSETMMLYSQQPVISFDKYIAIFFLQCLPDFDLTSPLNALTGGTEISWSDLLGRGLYDLLLRGGIFFAIAIAAFHHRELGVPRIFR